MNIYIKKLELTNFKCFRHKEFMFDSDVTTIRGRNGVGKTTIADAILWCLFGKNAQGQADFDLKTHDENGKPIPNLDHSVEMVLTTNAITGPNEITLKRTLKETWVKKRGSEEQVFKNNTTEYLVNGEVTTATDYKKYISELVSEDVFRAITSPFCFPSFKWQLQRDFLSNLAGDISPESIAGADEEIKELIGTLGEEDIIAYRKHLSYQIKKIKDSLDKIPVRLEEQNKALPEKLDWSALEVQSDSVSRQLKDIEQKILAIKSGNGDDIKKEELRKKLDELHKSKSEIEKQTRSTLFNKEQILLHDITEAGIKFNSLLNTQRDLENQIQSFDTLSKRCRETAEETFKSEQTYIREHWKETQIEFDSSEAVCPHCHQYLPDEQVAEAKQKFNQHKAELKRQLTERAEKAKKLMADAERQEQEYKSEKLFKETSLAEIKEQINTVFSEKAKLEKEKAELPTTESILAEDEAYTSLLKQIEEAKQQLTESSSSESEEDNSQLEETEKLRAEYNETLHQLQAQLATRTQYDKIQSLIDGINAEQRDLIQQLSELERKEDIARRYQDRQNTILEERINRHFSLVQWRMFRTVNNGGDPFDEPFCECYVNGVAYHDGLNQAARLNAGLDIINTLCKHYEVSAPIILDNSESSLNILQTIGQQIRLEVFDSELQLV